MRVRRSFDWSDIHAVCVEQLGWVAVKRGTLEMTADGDGVMFIDEDGDQVVIMGDRLIASALKPLPGNEGN